MHSGADWGPPDAKKIDASISCDLMVWWVRKKRCDESCPWLTLQAAKLQLIKAKPSRQSKRPSMRADFPYCTLSNSPRLSNNLS